MRIRRQSLILTALVLPACGVGSDFAGPGFVGFAVEGRAYHFDSGYAYGSRSGGLQITGGDRLAAQAWIEIILPGVGEAGSYELVAGGPTGEAQVTRAGTRYSTANPGGSGRVVISTFRCRTTVQKDLITGMTGPMTFCDVVGTFAFVGADGSGGTLQVVDGRFRMTL